MEDKVMVTKEIIMYHKENHYHLEAKIIIIEIIEEMIIIIIVEEMIMIIEET